MASTSEELSSQSEQMQQAIGFFRLGQLGYEQKRAIGQNGGITNRQSSERPQLALVEKKLETAQDTTDPAFERF